MEEMEGISMDCLYMIFEKSCERATLCSTEDLSFLGLVSVYFNTVVKDVEKRTTHHNDLRDRADNIGLLIDTISPFYSSISRFKFGANIYVISKAISGTIACAALTGNLELVKYARNKGYILSAKTCVAAACVGNLKMLKYIYKEFNIRNKYVYNIAARYGHLDCLKYAYENTSLHWDDDVIIEAACSGSLECFKYIHETSCVCHRDNTSDVVCIIDGKVFEVAADRGHLNIIRYAYEICQNDGDIRWNKQATANAISGGHLGVLEYMYDRGCPISKLAIIFVAENENIEILRYLHSKGFRFNEDVCERVALHGNLGALKYLRENGCPWNASASVCASLGGHLEVLKYLHDNGCPIDLLNCCRLAAKHGCLEILKYFHECGYHFNQVIRDNAEANEHLDVVEYIDAIGFQN
jgi:hypothetical protein